jgi:transposase
MGQQQADWMVLDEDECWFSRFVPPTIYGWSDQTTLRCIEHDAREQSHPALACYGVLRSDNRQVYLAFCEGQPRSEVTWEFIQGLLALARQEAKRVVVLIWDNAGWHLSKRLREWIHTYNRQAKHTHDVRLITHLLPRKSPWLNPIEPCWLHAKRATCELNSILELAELKRRLCAHFAIQPSDLPFNLCVPI